MIVVSICTNAAWATAPSQHIRGYPASHAVVEASKPYTLCGRLIPNFFINGGEEAVNCLSCLAKLKEAAANDAQKAP